MQMRPRRQILYGALVPVNTLTTYQISTSSAINFGDIEEVQK